MKKFICLVLILCVVLCTVSATLLDDDNYIPQGLNKIGVLKGTGEGFFLEKPVTRAEAVAFVLRICPFDAENAENKFSDMEAHWAKDAVAKATALGFIHGVTDTEFMPDKTVTGKEFSKMLMCMMGYTETDISNVYEISEKASLISNSIIKELISDNPLTRSDVLRLVYSSLLSEQKDGRLLKNALVDSGKFKDEDFEFMGCGVPANLSFEDRMYQQMPKGENVIFSPYSAKVAFAMAANGADGATKAEMLDTLGIEDLNAFNNKVKKAIESYKKSETLKIENANSIYLNESRAMGNKFADSFVNTVENYYDGTAKVVNDGNAVKTVNDWVNEKTRGKIPAIIQSNEFVAALVNAVYFKGTWQSEFVKAATEKREFHQFDGSVKETDFMHRTAYYNYTENNGIKIIELKYMSDYESRLNMSMYVMMGENGIEAPVSVLDRAELVSTKIKLALPKFKTETTIPLKQIMVDMGMKTAFDKNKSEIPFMLTQNAFLTDAIQKAYIGIDEEGTEAAAATAIMAGATSAPRPEEPIEVVFDKPFTYIIKDKTNNQILFIGTTANVK